MLKNSGNRCAYSLPALMLTAGLIFSGCGESGGGGSTTLRLASPLPETGTYGESLQQWADEVEAASGGEIEVEIYASGSLLAGTDIMPGVSDGRADLGLMFSNYHPEQLTLYNAVATPFVDTSGMAVAAAFATLYDESVPMQEQFEQAGIQPLAFIINGSAATGTGDSLTGINQLDGMRIRVPGTVAELLSLVGSDSVFLELTEMYEGLSRGVVDGWSGTEFASAMSLDLAEVTPHITDLGIGQYSSGAIIMNPNAWETLTDEQRHVIAEVSANYPEALAGLMERVETEACDILLNTGGEAARLDDAEIDRLRAETEDAINASLRDDSTAAGLSEAEHDEFVERYRELVTSYDNPEGYVDGLTKCIERST